MRSYTDAVERAVVLVAVMILTVLDAAVDAVIRAVFVKHIFHLCCIYRQKSTVTLSADKISIGKLHRAMHKGDF